MNMEEWQRRMRAEKDAERKKKMESSEILRGYRGGVKEEDLKLAALKQADRQKQLDAEQNLHSYRGKDEPGATRKRPERHDPQHPYPPVTMDPGVDPLQEIVPGSVSAKAATFNSPANDTQQQQQGDLGRMAMSGVIDAVPAPSLATEEVVVEQSTDEKKVEQEPAQEQLQADDDNVVLQSGTSLGDFVAPSSESTAFEADYFAASTPDSAPPVDAPVTREATTAYTQLDASQQQQQQQQQDARLDVHFSFGIITATTNPGFAAYMTAIEQVVTTALTGQAGVLFKPEFGPFVTNQHWDGTLEFCCPVLLLLQYVFSELYRSFIHSFIFT